MSCTVKADALPSGLLQQRWGQDGISYYRLDYSIVLLFGLTEPKAHICWTENVSMTLLTYRRTGADSAAFPQGVEKQ